MDEAVNFGHHDVVTLLQQYLEKYSPPAAPEDRASGENLDGLL